MFKIPVIIRYKKVAIKTAPSPNASTRITIPIKKAVPFIGSDFLDVIWFRYFSIVIVSVVFILSPNQIKQTIQLNTTNQDTMCVVPIGLVAKPKPIQ